MMSRSRLCAVLGAGVALALLLDPALAQTPTPEPAPAALVPNKGDTAWMLVSSALVLMMAVPGSRCSTAASCAPRTCCRS